jgi:hypothetical protein
MPQDALDPAVLPDPGLFGTSPAVTIFLTVIFMGGCALMTGRALANTWRPAWQVVPYALLLGLADRFLIYALFDGQLLSAGGLIAHMLILLVIALAAHQATRAGRMVSQYPWMYERVLFFGWRRRAS